MKQRLELRRFHARDGDHSPLLIFARTAVKVLDPEFSPSDDERDREVTSVPYEHTSTTFVVGDASKGFVVQNRLEHIEAGSVTLSADTTRVRAVGLPPDRMLLVETVRPPNHPAHDRTIAIEVEGSEEDVRAILGLFRATLAKDAASTN